MKLKLTILFIYFLGLANLKAQNWDTTTLTKLNLGKYNDITFLDSNHGFIVGDSNIFLETKDAGKNWTPGNPLKDFPKNFNKDLKQIIFLNDTLGFLRNAYYLFQTKDAGKTWESIISNNGGVISMNLFDGNLTVFSDMAFGNLLTSVYSEKHDTFSYEGGFYPVYYLEQAIRLNDSLIIIAKDSGQIFRSTDGGKTLKKTYSPSQDGLAHIRIADILFINQDTGFASLNYIWLKKTVDGGKSWFTDTTFNNVPVNSGTTKVFSWANGELYLNSVNFPGTNFIHKFNRNSNKWEFETKFKDNNLGFGYNNYAGIAGNGTGLFTVFENNILGYKTEWNYIKSIEENISKNLNVYPNPSKGTIYLNLSSKIIGTSYTIYNTLGKRIKNGEVTKDKLNVTIEKKGIYFIVIEQNGSVIGHNKIIIE